MRKILRDKGVNPECRLKIIEIRNSLVHFKAIPETFADSAEKDNFKKLDFDMFEIPKELDDLLLEQIHNLFPDLYLVNDMIDVILSEE